LQKPPWTPNDASLPVCRLKRDKPHNVQQKIVSTILKVKKVNNMYAEFKVLILVAALPLMTV